jgi:hypothetical protein
MPSAEPGVPLRHLKMAYVQPRLSKLPRGEPCRSETIVSMQRLVSLGAQAAQRLSNYDS